MERETWGVGEGDPSLIPLIPAAKLRNRFQDFIAPRGITLLPERAGGCKDKSVSPRGAWSQQLVDLAQTGTSTAVFGNSIELQVLF